jgi:peptide/nickel transport system substrate-binding protein
MPRPGPRPFAVLLAAALLAGACGEAAPTPAPTAEVTPPPTAPPSEGPFVPARYPEAGDAPCGAEGYAGTIRSISATDRQTVVFELCAPDPAFRAKIASPVLAINDSAWLEARIDPALDGEQAIVTEVNGTGPFRLDGWIRGEELTLARNDAYWGELAIPSLVVVAWRADAAQRLLELRAGVVDAIDGVPPRAFDTVRSDPSLQLKEREGLAIAYLGIDNRVAPFDDERVRRAIAMGLDRARVVDERYPDGASVASHFAPCTIPNGCAGDPWYEHDLAAARALLGTAQLAEGLTVRLAYPTAPDAALPDPAGVARGIAERLREDLGIETELVPLEPAAYADAAARGELGQLFLGTWSAAYPDLHFAAGASSRFGTTWNDLTAAIAEGAAGPDDAARAPAYVAANDAIRTHVPAIPLVRAGSAVALRSDVAGFVHASPLMLERLGVMRPGDRPQLVWLGEREPDGLHCADEASPAALRVCAQILESLYGYETAGTAAEPALAERCDPSPDLATWTCVLRDGVRFHDGAVLDANDVVLSWASAWDAAHPLHRGRTGTYPMFSRLFGGFLNPAGVP